MVSTNNHKGKEAITKQRKRQILNAARDVFSRKGFAEATTAEIAQTAGVSEGTIYNYFASKRDLLVSLIGGYALDESLLNLFKSPTINAIDSLPALLEDRIDIGFENSDLLTLLLAEIQRTPEFGEQYSGQVLNPGLALLKTYLDMRVKNGTLRPVDTEVASRAVVAMVVGLIAVHQIEGKDGFLANYPVKDLADEVANILSVGLGTKK
ncbi:MAG: TetR/AcrR family transcriptional regulator [Chloroflexi bacterium]|nr:TetR/AcrR family transcriptional regulator [Chloroflexota bacterium]MBT7080958.1 TetR/AcrR family transcriptional regulator [Chloroflexota bacterium]MBT7290089.1 TetR/AcrR family transcriptional regulator [Chloroflexota bacterium]